MTLVNHPRIALTVLIAAAALSPIGCGQGDKKSGSSGDSTENVPVVDLSKIENAFASATGTIKTEWDRIAAAVKSADYAGALASIQSLASNVSLSAEQKSALSQLMDQVKAKSADLWKGATDSAGKAVNQAADAASKAAEKATDAASKAAQELLPK